jgi:hypothetical protein
MSLGKALMTLGAALIAVGALVWLGGRLNLPLGRLPGDIRIERENFRFYFPLTTCLLLSVLVSVVVWVLRKR